MYTLNFIIYQLIAKPCNKTATVPWPDPYIHINWTNTQRIQVIKKWRRLVAKCVIVHWSHMMKWKHFPRYWPFVRGIHWSPVYFPHKGQWRGALVFSLICVWINGWVNNGDVGDLRRHHTHYDVTVMHGACTGLSWWLIQYRSGNSPKDLSKWLFWFVTNWNTYETNSKPLF